MLLTDLLDLPVHDHTGHRIGWVCDVRFLLPDIIDERSVPAPEVAGILVSPHRRGSYLGFERTDVHAPVLLARWIRWRQRGTYLVRWADVDQVDEDAVVLTIRYRRHSPLLTR
jgi:sporulation protein YlmC with PRC-barrel domain